MSNHFKKPAAYSESRCVGSEACPKCGSSDNLKRYDDGHAWCFTVACNYFEPGDQSTKVVERADPGAGLDLLRGEVPAGGLERRSITEETCRKFGYWVSEYKDHAVQVANYRDAAGTLVGQKVRGREKGKKTFLFLGDNKKSGLFGEHLWKPGRRLVITEGELDAMSVSQAMGNKWPVVSIKNGAQGAAKDVAKSIEFVSGFDAVVIMFDMDDAGRAAAREVAEILPPGKAFIAELPLKDASDMLVGGKGRELVNAAWEARPYRPDGVVGINGLLETILGAEDDVGIPYPWHGINDKARGLRRAEIVTFAMGSGVGKSTMVRELGYYLHMRGEQVGMLMLEETTRRTAQALLGLHMRRRLHLNPAPRAEVEKAWAELFNPAHEIFLYDHFGSTQIENLLNRVRFMATGLGCKWIVLDHLSIAVSGLDVGDERKELDLGMTKLRQLVQELDIGLLLVVHVKRPSGDKGFEQGLRPRMNHIRGTQGIAQLSDIIITGSPAGNGDTNVWVEKNRFSGDTHRDDEDPCVLTYDKETGWYAERSPFENEAANEEAQDSSTAF